MQPGMRKENAPITNDEFCFSTRIDRQVGLNDLNNFVMCFLPN